MQWQSYVTKFLDPYDIKARLFPGLLVLLPIITFFALLFGPKNPALATLMSIVSVCGGPYLLASFVRTRGQNAQESLYIKWGGQPSTILMRHRGQRLASQTKIRYQQLVTTKLGVVMPSIQEEERDPSAADNSYRAAADALRPLVIDKKKYPFVFKELIAYGFNRNSFGVRWIGAGITLVVIVATFAQAGIFQSTSPWIQENSFSQLKFAHILILLVCIFLLLMWMLHFTAKTVEQAGFSYALRLWESLESVGKRPVRK